MGRRMRPKSSANNGSTSARESFSSTDTTRSPTASPPSATVASAALVSA